MHARSRWTDWPLRGAATALLLLGAAGCMDEALHVLAVEPASAPAVVTFRVLDPTLFYGLTVASCRTGRPVWVIENEKLGSPPARISYGVLPDGFVAHAGPLPLLPGCYTVTASGPSTVRFTIGPDGRVVGDSVAVPASRTAHDSGSTRPR